MAILTSIADQLIAEQGINVDIPEIYTSIADSAFAEKTLESIIILRASFNRRVRLL